ncbi:MAG: GAF and ANTAR domain-containing protein [Acidimicrobiia bacterium]
MTDPDPARLTRVTRGLAVDAPDPARSLCSASADMLGVAGAGLVLMTRARALGNVCVSDPWTEAVEDVQYALGEGPCVDAVRSCAPVLVPDLEELAVSRWSVFRISALEAGVRAAFGFPLLMGNICIGALDLYHDETGALSAEQFADAEAVAHVATRTVLAWQAVAGADDLPWQLEQVPVHRAAVHQATGMVSVQAMVSVDDALALLRAYAFVDGRGLGSVAADVVAGRLRLEN